MQKITLITLVMLSILVLSCDTKKRKKKDKTFTELSLPNKLQTGLVNTLFKDIKGDNASLKLEILPFDKNKVPQVMQKYKGKLVEGAHWKDKNGEQWLLLTETGEIEKKKGKTDTSGHLVEEPEVMAEAYAYFWVKKHESYVQYRQDFWIEPCGPFDVLAEFHKKGFTVTDVDKNGWAEVTLTYKHYCKSDVSPSDLTLRMIEQDKVYELHGTTKIDMGQAMKIGGKRKDGNFVKAPKAFKTHIDKIWKAVVIEKI